MPMQLTMSGTKLVDHTGWSHFKFMTTYFKCTVKGTQQPYHIMLVTHSLTFLPLYSVNEFASDFASDFTEKIEAIRRSFSTHIHPTYGLNQNVNLVVVELSTSLTKNQSLFAH